MAIDILSNWWGQKPDFLEKSGFLRLNSLSDRYFQVGTETRLLGEVGFLASQF
jgi:hypothetical protein